MYSTHLKIKAYRYLFTHFIQYPLLNKNYEIYRDNSQDIYVIYARIYITSLKLKSESIIEDAIKFTMNDQNNAYKNDCYSTNFSDKVLNFGTLNFKIIIFLILSRINFWLTKAFALEHQT